MASLRKQIAQLLYDAVVQTARERSATLPESFSVRVDYPPEAAMGAYASPVALELAKPLRDNPRKIAESIVSKMATGKDKLVLSASILGPGFINLSISPVYLCTLLYKVHLVDAWLAESNAGETPEKIIFEYVSANPTGPLNVVSARAASVGDSLCRILKAAGQNVFREYYVNDYGNQVEMLGLSFAIRYLEKKSIKLELPENAYQGEYIIDFLNQILADKKISDELAAETAGINDIEQALSWAQSKAGWFSRLGIQAILDSQKEDLAQFKVEFDNFFSETTLHESGKVSAAYETLKQAGYIFENEGAQAFRSTEFGDDKDRVVIRSDGRPTYLLADIAYHYDKIQRGFNRIYDIWGPDHHGYIKRLSGAITASGFGKTDAEKFEVIIAQQVNLLEGGSAVVMSKRLGKFQTMRDLLEKIPADVLRYFFVMRGLNTHLDFDLELALTESSQNPVYYIQYAHARIHSIFREAAISFETPDKTAQEIHAQSPQIQWLQSPTRINLLLFILRYPELVEDIARNLEAQRLPEYLTELARLFTAFYHAKENNVKNLLTTDKAQADFLLTLCRFCALTLSHGLSLLGISSPREM
jgi:arginyl-tRNA synthetase